MSGRRRVKAAELDAKLNYDLTRRWFAAVRNHGTVSASYIIHVEPRRGTVLRITHASGLVHDTDFGYLLRDIKAGTVPQVVTAAGNAGAESGKSLSRKVGAGYLAVLAAAVIGVLTDLW